jgi:hypothetical protein
MAALPKNKWWPAFSCLLAGGVLFVGPVSLLADDWQALLGKTPFGQATVTPGSAPGALEFRGVVQEDGMLLVNLYNPATKTAQWVEVNGRQAGLEVRAYDAATDQVQVAQAGRLFTLPLKLARVALVGYAAPVQLINPADPPAADEAAGLPEFMRNLPPDARKLLEEVRRRRAIRSPFPTAATVPAAEPETAPASPRGTP